MRAQFFDFPFLVGNGANVLTETAGRNLVIGGGDILIGSTLYDQNRAALDALLAIWDNAALSYNVRVADLLIGISYQDSTGTHTAALDADSTASQPVGSQPSTLKGGSALDWFFAASSDIIKNSTKGEIVSTL